MSCLLKKHGKTIIFVFAVLLIGFFSYSLLSLMLSADSPNVHHSQYNIEASDGKVVRLSGDWQFYWDKLLYDGDFIGNEETAVGASIPGVWNNIEIGGKKLPGFGFGTYRMTVSGLTPGQKYALYIPLLSVSYDVYADDELIAKNGTVADSADGFKPSFLPQTGYFTARSSEADIIVHSSNFIYARNGMWHAIYFGAPGQIESLNRAVIYKDLFMIGAFVTLAVYYVAIYVLRKDRQSLLFVLLCVGATMRMVANGDRAVTRLFEGFPFELIVKFDYLAILLFYPIMLFLMKRRFPDEISRRLTLIFFGLGTAFSLFVIAAPVSLFTQFVIVFEIHLLLTILYTLFALGRAVLRSRKNALPMFFSVLLLLILTVFDALYQNGMLENPIGEISAFGFFSLLLMESFAIARDNADSYRHSISLSMQLLENDKLKDRIHQTEMAFLQSQIKPHFLFNSLSAIDETFKINPEEASRLINSLAQYLRRSFDFENLESCVPIERELALVKYYVDLELARFDNLSVQSRIDYNLSFQLPPLTIQPLIENAIRHGVRKKAGSGEVVLWIRQDGDDIAVSVSDNGAGIVPEKLSSLLDNTGKSVGMTNIHHRLLHLYGSGLSVESSADVGTTVSFKIPKGNDDDTRNSSGR